jgi:hypothetical protein
MRQSSFAPGSGASEPSGGCIAVASLTLAGENKRVNSELKYSPKEGFVKSRNGEFQYFNSNLLIWIHAVTKS